MEWKRWGRLGLAVAAGMVGVGEGGGVRTETINLQTLLKLPYTQIEVDLSRGGVVSNSVLYMGNSIIYKNKKKITIYDYMKKTSKTVNLDMKSFIINRNQLIGFVNGVMTAYNLTTEKVNTIDLDMIFDGLPITYPKAEASLYPLKDNLIFYNYYSHPLNKEQGDCGAFGTYDIVLMKSIWSRTDCGKNGQDIANDSDYYSGEAYYAFDEYVLVGTMVNFRQQDDFYSIYTGHIFDYGSETYKKAEMSLRKKYDGFIKGIEDSASNYYVYSECKPERSEDYLNVVNEFLKLKVKKMFDVSLVVKCINNTYTIIWSDENTPESQRVHIAIIGGKL